MKLDFAPWKKAWGLLDARERRNAIFVLLFSLIGTVSSVGMIFSVVPFLQVLADPNQIDEVPQFRYVYDFFDFQSYYEFLTFLGFFSVFMIFLTNIIQAARAYIIGRYTTMRSHSVSMRLLGHYLGSEYDRFTYRHSGEMGTKILSESAQVVGGFLKPTLDLITSLISIIGIVSFLIWLRPGAAFSALALLGSAYAITYLVIRPLLRKLGRVRFEQNESRFRIAGEALGGFKDIKLLGREGAYLNSFETASLRMNRVTINANLLASLPQFMVQSIAMSGLIVFCLVLLDPNASDVGAQLAEVLPLMGAFVFAGQRLLPELGRVYGSLAKVQAGGIAVERIFEEVGSFPSLDKKSFKTKSSLPLRDNITFQEVTYYYPSDRQAGVRDVSLSIRSGERIGIVGSTGAGKTTLADLLLGLLTPQSGMIAVDDVVLNRDTQRAWQKSVGYVPQNIFLADASIAENVALGIPKGDIDIERVGLTLDIAQLSEFVAKELPEGLDTKIGERGIRLSGGQKQRIGIARALYHNAQLIVFDEATSALDNATERDVMDAINALPGDKTIILIAHRLSTVRNCDRIAVLDNGSLVGFDTWDALTEQNATFNRIARLSLAS
ncbi:MAG: ABC transporter ATP-binding protein [Paracoccaceae bacterium]